MGGATTPSTCSTSAELQYLPTQLQKVVEAVISLKENIAVLCFQAERSTTEEVADLGTNPCDAIVRDLRSVMVMQSECLRITEQHTRAQVGAEITALLHAFMD
jgi:hypothetical protein